MKRSICCFLGCTLFLLSGCTPMKMKNDIPAKVATLRPGIEERNIGAWSIPVPLVPESELYGFGLNTDGIYYLESDPMPMGQTNLASRILSLASPGFQPKLLHSVNGTPHFINELVALDHSLFWVYRDSSIMRIDHIDLRDNSIQTLQTFDASVPDVLLTGSGSYLTWYQLADGQVSLYAYDEDKNESFLVETEVYCASPYERAYVLQGITAYLVPDGNGFLLRIYDLETRKIIHELPLAQATAGLQANRNWCVWQEDNAISIYQWQVDAERKLLSEKDKQVVFSMHLVDESLWVNQRNPGGLKVIQLDSLELIDCDNLEMDTSRLIWGTACISNFAAFDPQTDSLLMCSIQPLEYERLALDYVESQIEPILELQTDYVEQGCPQSNGGFYQAGLELLQTRIDNFHYVQAYKGYDIYRLDYSCQANDGGLVVEIAGITVDNDNWFSDYAGHYLVFSSTPEPQLIGCMDTEFDPKTTGFETDLSMWISSMERPTS